MKLKNVLIVVSDIEKSKKYAAIQDLFLRIYINPKYEDIMQAYHNAFEELTK